MEKVSYVTRASPDIFEAISWPPEGGRPLLPKVTFYKPFKGSLKAFEGPLKAFQKPLKACKRPLKLFKKAFKRLFESVLKAFKKTFQKHSKGPLRTSA